MCEPDDCESIPQHNSLDFWDYSIELECLKDSQGNLDLQLAAELGKTLLERNKELETSLKQHQHIVDDQAQEIEYLTKQTVALREVNDSRLRIYEQLEVSIHDLERANHRLVIDSTADKKQVKALIANVDALELKCEELQNTIDDLTLQVNAYKKKIQKRDVEIQPVDPWVKSPGESECNGVQAQIKKVQCVYEPSIPIEYSTSKLDISGLENIEADQIDQLLVQLRDVRSLRASEHRRITELEEQLAALVQENQKLQNQLVSLSSKEEEMKSMHEELTTLEEVRQGHLCARCLRNTDDMSILDLEEDDDNHSMIEALISETRYHSSLSLDIQQETNPEVQATPQTNNCYRDLVEKYEKLMQVNRNHKSANFLSLQEELQMSINSVTEENKCKSLKASSQTPTDFSEAETSSSGFADEISNKATQTDGRPGSFLCSIADGEDCKFSIYDDASTLDSRFRNRPEYRVLFKEIFTVLKKAAENKDDGDELPLLDDCVPKVPPVTPSTEQFPGDFTDGNDSITSGMSDNSVGSNTPIAVAQTTPEPQKVDIKTGTDKEKGVVLTPYKREPLDYISVAVNVRKKSSKKSKKHFNDRSESPILTFSPKINYSPNNGFNRRSRENKSPAVDNNLVWNGASLQFKPSNKGMVSPTPSDNSEKYQGKSPWKFKPSTASQDLNKLKKLDLSYAEVLRNADKKRETLTKNIRRK